MTIAPEVLIALIGTLTAAIGTVAKVVYSDIKKDRDFWRDLALRSVRTAETAVDKLPEKRDA